MARGTRPFRQTSVTRYPQHEGRHVVHIHTTAHARAELALDKARGWVNAVVWHADACPFRDPKLGTVR